MVFARSVTLLSRHASTLLPKRAAPVAHNSCLGGVRTLTATSKRQVRKILTIRLFIAVTDVIFAGKSIVGSVRCR